MIAALCVTPLRELTRVNLLRFRRMLGLMAFWYAVMHLAVWLLLDQPARLAPHPGGPLQASLHRARVHRADAAGAAGGDLLGRGGAAARRRGLAQAAPAGLPGDGAGGDPFRLAGQGRPPEPLVYAAIAPALLGYRALRGRLRRPARAAAGGRA